MEVILLGHSAHSAKLRSARTSPSAAECEDGRAAQIRTDDAHYAILGGGAPSRQSFDLPGASLDVRQILSQLSARRSTIGFVLSCCLAFALVYLVLSPPRYLASASVFVDPPQMRLNGEPNASAQRPSDTSEIESQVQILQSDLIAERVLDKIGLLKSPETLKADDATFPFDQLRSLISQIQSASGLESNDDSETKIEDAVGTLKRNLRVRRIGQTQVIEVTYSSTDIQRAADVPNAVIKAYIEDKRQYQSEITRRSIDWMSDQLEKARLQAEQTEQAMQDFRAQGSDDRNIAQYRTRLKELDAYARLHRGMHEAMLPRFNELQQREGLPVIDARILELAKTPKIKSHPRTSQTLFFAVVIGLLGGVGFAIMRDYFSGFRSTRDVEAALRIKAFGVIPRTSLAQTPARADAEARVCTAVTGPARIVLDAPLSRYAATMRSARAAIDQRRTKNSTCVIGVTSAFTGEGRSTLCTNLAQLLGASGVDVLMIDADLYTRSLSRRLATGEDVGLVNLLLGETTLADAMWVDPVSGASFLPVGTDGADADPARILSSGTILASPEAGMYIAELAEGFNYVIVCLPPFATSIDVVSSIDWVDSFLLAIEWDRIPPSLAATAFADVGKLGGKVAGAILNKVDPIYLKRTEGVKPLPPPKRLRSWVPPVRRVVVPNATDRLRGMSKAETQVSDGGTGTGKASDDPDEAAVRRNSDDKEDLTKVCSAAPVLELGTARRLAGQVTGSALKYTGALTRGIVRVRDNGLVTHVYAHQPSARQFHDCLAWLLDRGYVPVSTADILAARNDEKILPPLALHVSLDDAFRSNLTQVVPVARELGVPVTVFVPTEPVERGWFWWSCVERVAKDSGRTVERLKSVPNSERLDNVALALRKAKPHREAMTIEELRSIAALSHVTIGSHTVTHPILTQCSDADLEYELLTSKERLERWIGKPVTAFAYPNGTFGEREVEAVRRAGYAIAFTVEQRHALPSEADPLRLPRFALTNDGPLIENVCRALGVWSIPVWQPRRASKTRANEAPAALGA